MTGALVPSEGLLPASWPATAIEPRAVGDLVPYARNARTHSDAQVEQIAASIGEFGWTIPVLVDEEGVLIAGHGRLLAAAHLGIAHVPTMVARGWSEAQRRAYVLADNKLTLNGGWDEGVLAGELLALKGDGFDLGLTGFDMGELDDLGVFGSGGLGGDPDDAPAVEEKAVTDLGEVWLLGDHRIVCGDATDADVVALALDGDAPNLMVTDPPYGVEYEPDWRNKALGGSGRAEGSVRNDDRADWSEAWALFPGSVAYVWHADRFGVTVLQSLETCGFGLRAQIVWVKPRFAIGRGHYHFQHEPCWMVEKDAEPPVLAVDHEIGAYVVKAGSAASWKGGRKQSTVWQIEHVKCDTGHGTQKPVECMARPIRNNSLPGEAIYEPFSGSGSTIMACETEGRRARAVELNPLYVDVAVRRWQEFTGREATLEGDGRSFAEIEAQRLG